MKSKTKFVKVKAECQNCDGTGLWLNNMGGNTVFVFCSVCQGTGYVIHCHKAFSGLKIRTDVRLVRYSEGCMTYYNFLLKRVGRKKADQSMEKRFDKTFLSD